MIIEQIKRMSLKDCWYYGKIDLVPESRTLKNCILSFIERKTSNTVFSQPRHLNIFQKLEVEFWNLLELKTRKLWNRNKK